MEARLGRPAFQAYKRKLARVNLRERTFLRQGKRATPRLKPCHDETDLRLYFPAQVRFAALCKKACLGLTRAVRLWPRVDMSQSFVLRELRRILHICQNRVEMPSRSWKPRDFWHLERGKLGTYLQTEDTRESRGGRALLSLGEALDNILF